MVSLLNLSSSINGKLINVPSGSAAAVNIHKAQAGTTYFDQIFLYACNNNNVNSDLFVLYGSGSISDTIQTTIPSKSGRYMVLDGTVLQNSLQITAYSSTGSLSVDGYVFVHSA